ncbi:MAG TPA: hypothetical protein ENK18_15025 [Deltaproteobacteria bacterium]|nr:hypothetical protein [Deltaproteobacteria bacterium]
MKIPPEITASAERRRSLQLCTEAATVLLVLGTPTSLFTGEAVTPYRMERSTRGHHADALTSLDGLAQRQPAGPTEAEPTPRDHHQVPRRARGARDA